MSSASSRVQGKAVQAVAEYISRCNLDMTPPALAADVYQIIEGVTGAADPYAEKKKESNEAALALLPSLEKELAHCEGKDAFMLAVRFAIAGNIIDYGAFYQFDMLGTIDKCREADFAIDHSDTLVQVVQSLPEGASVLYLADNCGEIVFDRLLLGQLHEKGLKITVAVKDGPIINDALIADAYSAGLDRYAHIISNGTRCPGTVLEHVSKEFMEIYTSADLIISKGQGNFESLSEADRDIFFLLTVKCAAAASHIKKLTGCENSTITGAGEMAVYRSSPQ